MKSEDILRALSEMDPEMLRECGAVRQSQARRARPGIFLLVAASILIAGVAAVFFSVRYRGRMTANLPEQGSSASVSPEASDPAEETGTEKENVPELQDRALVFEKEITLNIPDHGRILESTAEFNFSNEMKHAVGIVGYDGFRNTSDNGENLLNGYQFQDFVRTDSGPYKYSRYTFKSNDRGSVSVTVKEDSVQLYADLEPNNAGYAQDARLDFCLESFRKAVSDEGEEPVVIHFIVNLKAPDSIICFHREIPVLLEDDGKIHLHSNLPYPENVADFMNQAWKSSGTFFSAESGAISPLNAGGKDIFYVDEVDILPAQADSNYLMKCIYFEKQGGDGSIELYFSDESLLAAGDFSISAGDYDPEGILRIEFVYQVNAENAVLFTLDILPRKQEDLNEEIPVNFGTETAAGVPPAVSDYMKNNREKILSILTAEGHEAPADPEEILVLEPFVVYEMSELTEQGRALRNSVNHDYYYPVISGGRLYSVLKCTIPETANVSDFLQVYQQNKIKLEEDGSVLWYLQKEDTEKHLFEGEGVQYRVFYHSGFFYSHSYDVIPVYYSDGTPQKVFMNLTGK